MSTHEATRIYLINTLGVPEERLPVDGQWNLNGLDLSGEEMHALHLNDVSCVGTNLTGANLSSSDLSESNLAEAILDGANLSRAVLRNTCFFKASLIMANLTGAQVHNAEFTYAEVKESDWTEVTGLRGMDVIDMHGFELAFMDQAFVAVAMMLHQQRDMPDDGE